MDKKTKKLTDKDLYEFVYRADTPQKVAAAERWLREHQHLTSQSTLEELLNILNQTAKRLFRMQIAEYEEHIYKYGLEINTITGEVIASA